MDTAARLDKQSQGARQSGIEDTFQHRSSKSQFFFQKFGTFYRRLPPTVIYSVGGAGRPHLQ